jgi:hypothetical protein
MLTCPNWARTDLCGGREVTRVPTAIALTSLHLRDLGWRIVGPLLVMSDKSWRLLPAPRQNVRGVQWLLMDGTGRRCTSLFMTPDGRIGTRWELGLRYRSQTMWTGKRLAHRRHKVIEKLTGPTDYHWARDHPTYVPEKPKRMRWSTYRRLRKRLTTTPRRHPELDEFMSLIDQPTR